jgi:hypothetical protein
LGGEEFRERITAEIDRSKVAIVIWSANSVASRFVIDEADHAGKSGKLLSAIVPGFKAEKIPIGFRGAQVVSIGEGEQLIRALISLGVGDVRKTGSYLLGIFARQIKAIERNTRKPQRLVLAAFAVVSVLAALFGVSQWLLRPQLEAAATITVDRKWDKTDPDAHPFGSLVLSFRNSGELGRLFAPSYVIKELNVVFYDPSFRLLRTHQEKMNISVSYGTPTSLKFEFHFAFPRTRDGEVFAVACALVSKDRDNSRAFRIGTASRFGESEYLRMRSLNVGNDQIEALQLDTGCKLGANARSL